MMNGINSKKKFEAVRNKDTGALGDIIGESCRDLYVYAAVIEKNRNSEIRLLVDTYVNFWRNVSDFDPDCNMDIALRKILLAEAGIENKGRESEKVESEHDSDFDRCLYLALHDADHYWVMPDYMENEIISDTFKAISSM